MVQGYCKWTDNQVYLHGNDARTLATVLMQLGSFLFYVSLWNCKVTVLNTKLTVLTLRLSVNIYVLRSDVFIDADVSHAGQIINFVS